MRYVIYFRVSTQQQGVSGLGLEAQQTQVKQFLKPDDVVLDTFTEIESGRNPDRPILAEAILMAGLKGAILLIAKLDRLARSIFFISKLQDSKVKFIACDCPQANETMIQMIAVFAEYESKQISERTKAALAQAKLRGVKLGNPQNLKTSPEDRLKAIRARQKKADDFVKSMMPIIKDIQKGGIISYRGIAKELNIREFKTRRLCQWHGNTVKNLLKRYEAYSNPISLHNPKLSQIPSKQAKINQNNPQEYYEGLMELESFQNFLRDKLSGPNKKEILEGLDSFNLNKSSQSKPSKFPVLLPLSDKSVNPLVFLPSLPNSVNLPIPLPILPNPINLPILPSFPSILPDSINLPIPPPIINYSATPFNASLPILPLLPEPTDLSAIPPPLLSSIINT